MAIRAKRGIRFSRNRLKALDLGMGYGRNALWLAAQGYQVDAWEADRRYLAEARREARRRGVRWANEPASERRSLGGVLCARRRDFTRAPLKGPYDVIVISHALHQVRRSQALRVLARARTALARGGWLFLQVRLASDPHFQRLTTHADWKPVPAEANTRRHRRRGWVQSALTPAEVNDALQKLRRRHYREVLLKSHSEQGTVTSRVAEVAAQKPGTSRRSRHRGHQG